MIKALTPPTLSVDLKQIQEAYHRVFSALSANSARDHIPASDPISENLCPPVVEKNTSASQQPEPLDPEEVSTAWIDCRDQQPLPGHWVMLYDLDDEETYIAYVDDEGIWRDTNYDCPLGGNPFCWAPIPYPAIHRVKHAVVEYFPEAEANERITKLQEAL